MLLAGFTILTLHCIHIQRLPDVELPSLIVLFGASCGYFLVLLALISTLGILPQYAFRYSYQLRRDTSPGRKGVSIVAWPSIWLSFAGWLVLAGLRFRHPQWMTLASLAVIWIGLPVFLTANTKWYWVRVVAEQSIIINQEVNEPAARGKVYSAFFVWAFSSTAYPLVLSWLMRIASTPDSGWFVAAALVLAANLGVDVQAALPETLEDKHRNNRSASSSLFVLEQPASSRFWLFGCWLHFLRKRHCLSQPTCCRQNLARVF